MTLKQLGDFFKRALGKVVWLIYSSLLFGIVGGFTHLQKEVVGGEPGTTNIPLRAIRHYLKVVQRQNTRGAQNTFALLQSELEA